MTSIIKHKNNALFLLAVYLTGTFLLLYRLGSHPAFPYNWENYTIWYFLDFWHQPVRDLLQLTDGVMTDSGKSPLAVIPIWIIFKTIGIGLFQLRLPFAILSGLVIPVFWLVTKRISGIRTANLAIVLLIISPVFLLYGRTATLVGISLLPMIITVYVLLRFLQKPAQWYWLIILQILFMINTYGYTPIRFLWVLSIFIFLLELVLAPAKRYIFMLAAAATILILPLYLTLFYKINGPFPVTAISTYFNSRGEQIFTINSQNAFHYYLRENTGNINQNAMLTGLMRQNMIDYGIKILDINTKPSITAYANANGRLYPFILVPFFLAGLIFSFIKAVKSLEFRVLLILFWGFGLPIIFTSHADIGRLIFTLPFLFIITADGFIWLTVYFYNWLSKVAFFRHLKFKQNSFLILAGILLVAVNAIFTWQDFHKSPEIPADQNLCTILKNTPAGSKIIDRSYYFGCK